MPFTKQELLAALRKKSKYPRNNKLSFIDFFMKPEGYSYDVNNVQRLLENEIARNEEEARTGEKVGASVNDMLRFLANKATVDKIPFWLMPYMVKHAYYLIKYQKGAWETREYLFADLKEKIGKEKDISMSVP